MKSILAFCALLSTWTILGAQTPAGVGPKIGVVIGAPPPVAIQNKQQAFINSLPLFAAHNYAAAESALEAPNLAATGTPQWQFESGFALIQMAFQFQSQRDAVTATAVARLALARLRLADQTFGSNGSPGEIANEKEMTGYVYEFLLGDRATAKTYYQAAVNLSPKTGNAAALLAAVTAIETAESQKRSSVDSN